jgi:hypothetical protein
MEDDRTRPRKFAKRTQQVLSFEQISLCKKRNTSSVHQFALSNLRSRTRMFRRSIMTLWATRYDDMVDMMTQAAIWLFQRSSGRRGGL